MSAQGSRRVLLISPYFPPDGGSGVQRGAKFAKYLMREGWDVIVITIDPATYHVHDHSLLSDVAGARVAAVPVSRIPGVNHRMLATLPGMRRAIEDAFRRFEPHAVLATTPDFHWLPAAGASRRHGVPLILDYPDPWTVLPDDFRIFRPPEVAKSRLKWRVAPIVEARVLKTASAALFATKPILEEYASVYPRVARMGTVVTNGFDSEDFVDGAVTAVADRPEGEPLRIAHVGSFAGMRSPIPMAEAIRVAAPMVDRKLEACFVGDGVLDAEQRLREILDGVAAVRVLGWQPHRAAIAEMQSASVLWLDAMAHFRAASTGKIFEYLRCGRPVLAVAHPTSPAADLIRTFEAGTVVPSTDPEVSGPALANLIRSLPAWNPTDPKRLSAFDWSSITARVSECLEAALSSGTNRAVDTD